jgi:hypothetical protein
MKILYAVLTSPMKLYIELCTQEDRRGIGWWKMGIWILKGVKGNTEQGMCPICNKEDGWSHTLRCGGTRSWREELVDKRFASIEPEIGMRRTATIKEDDTAKRWAIFKLV